LSFLDQNSGPLTPLVPASGPLVPASGPLVPASGSLVPASGSLVPASGPLVPASGPLIPSFAQTSSYNHRLHNDANKNLYQFRKDLLRYLTNEYDIKRYEHVDIRLDSLESSVEILLNWMTDAPVEDLLKNPVIILNE
jgi:hypothetical protein